MKKLLLSLLALGLLAFSIRTEQEQRVLEDAEKKSLVEKEVSEDQGMKDVREESSSAQPESNKEDQQAEQKQLPKAIDTLKQENNKADNDTDTPNTENKPDTAEDVSDQYLIDEIVCTVNGPERTQIFCISDRERSAIGGGGSQSDNAYDKTMEHVINELIYQDAIRYKIPIDDSVIHTYIDSVRRQQGWTLEDVTAVFKASGYYSFQDGFEQLRIMYAVNAMIDGKIKQSLVVTEADVIAYYNEHPMFEEEAYKIQIGLISFDKKQTSKEQMATIQEYIKTNKGDIVITWNAPFWLKKNEMAEQLYNMIMSMNPGDISEPQRVAEGFEVYKLVKKKPRTLVPLKKRYREIVELLRKPKFEQLYANYKKSLFDSASIVYFGA